MDNKVSIRINLSNSEVEISGSPQYMHEVQPVLTDLITLLKEHIPQQSQLPGLKIRENIPVYNSVRSAGVINENSQVYEHSAPVSSANPLFEKKINKTDNTPYPIQLFKKILQIGKRNFSNVDVILLAAFILQNQQNDKPFITRELNKFLKEVDFTVSNLSHFLKLNVEYGKLGEENKNYYLTAFGDEHLDSIFGIFIENAKEQLSRSDG